ncbi:3-hydroxybutyryl-CoA dehydratase [Desulfitispora alkaliphila]|uniref:MaoC family dehydratase n=1 Tax=Desulfitispora alkaliphila TaxID=622674 RepID=UPI003D1E8753
MINDRPYEEIKIGEQASFSKTITEADIVGFAGLTGDFNPIHVDNAFAEKSIFKGRIAHGMLTGAFISTVLGTALPGKNTVYMSQEMKFVAPAYIGDTLTATVEVINKRDDKRILELKTTVTNQAEKEVVIGQAKVMKLKD